MNCFLCKKECVMQTEECMSVTPCMVCARADKLPDALCRECFMTENVCNFVEREENESVEFV